LSAGCDIAATKKGDLSFGTKSNMIQQVVKAFNQYFVNTKHIGVEGNKMVVSDANTKDASYYQIVNWQNNFNDVFHNKYLSKDSKTFVQDAIKPLRTLKTLIDNTGTSLTTW